MYKKFIKKKINNKLIIEILYNLVEREKKVTSEVKRVEFNYFSLKWN